jgi:hypothetical protein
MIRRKLIEHGIAITLVGIAFVLLYLLLNKNLTGSLNGQQKYVNELAALPFIDWNNPAERSLFKDVWIMYYPDQKTEVDSLLAAVVDRTISKTESVIQTRNRPNQSLGNKIQRLWPMYFKFIIVYIIVLIFSYYAAQTAAVWRFVRMKQQRSSYLLLLYNSIKNRPGIAAGKSFVIFLVQCLKWLGLAAGKGVLYLVLFAPAYVIAYAFKTRFDTNSILFMILLGSFSNGLLITYTQKFFAFLVAESRKGYLQTAVVKNLFQSYDQRSKEGISLNSMVRLKKVFPGHVFGHIYGNARYQYLPTLKEQASFLITGLIIIEMALNIQNHLCYDLLQNILYQDYVSVLITCFGLFLIVKGTDVITDLIYLQESAKYENR